MIEIYTDGSYSSSLKKGSYGIIVKQDKKHIHSYITDDNDIVDSTNNRAELKAVLTAIKYIKDNSITNATIFCDSQYVVNGFNDWFDTWQRNGFRGSNKKPIKNKELWCELKKEAAGLTFKLTWVRGHDSSEGNNEIDQLVQANTQK